MGARGSCPAPSAVELLPGRHALAPRRPAGRGPGRGGAPEGADPDARRFRPQRLQQLYRHVGLPDLRPVLHPEAGRSDLLLREMLAARAHRLLHRSPPGAHPLRPLQRFDGDGPARPEVLQQAVPEQRSPPAAEGGSGVVRVSDLGRLRPRPEGGRGAGGRTSGLPRLRRPHPSGRAVLSGLVLGPVPVGHLEPQQARQRTRTWPWITRA